MSCSACLKFNAMDRCQGCVLATLDETPELENRLKFLEALYGLHQLKSKAEAKVKMGADLEDWIRRKSYHYEKISQLESEVHRLQTVVEGLTGISGAAPFPKKPGKVISGPSAGTRSAVQRVAKGTAGPPTKKPGKITAEVAGPSAGTRSAVQRVAKGIVLPVPKKKPQYKSLSSFYEQEAAKGTAGPRPKKSGKLIGDSGSSPITLPPAPPVPRKPRSVQRVALAADALIGLQGAVPDEQPQQVEVQDHEEI